MKRAFSCLLVSIFALTFLPMGAEAAISKALCFVQVNVNGLSATVEGTVTESRPGLDPSYTRIQIYDNGFGSGVDGTGQDSVSASYTSTYSPGIYVATVQGDSASNPNGGTSDCIKTQVFTIGAVFGCTDPSATNYNPDANVDDGSCQYSESPATIKVRSNLETSWTVSGPVNFSGSGTSNGSGFAAPAGTYNISAANLSCYSKSVAPSASQSVSPASEITFTITYTYNCEGGGEPPGPFNLISNFCLSWPSPRVEIDFQPSSNATSYTLERRVGSGSYSAVFSGNFEQMDQYSDPVAQNTTYEYRIIAYNDNGSTISGNTIVITTSEANCSPPPSAPVCAPASQTVGVNSPITLSASAGNGTYSWSALGGSPASGSGGNFTTSFSSAGTKTIRLTSGSQSAECTAEVSNVPSCMGAAPQDTVTTGTSGNFYLYAYGVSGATSVFFPTWSEVNGQDDIQWYPGSYIGNDTWRAAVNLASHRVGNPDYGFFPSHVYLNNGSYSNVWCGTAHFTRTAPSSSCSVTATPAGSANPTIAISVGGWDGSTHEYKVDCTSNGSYEYTTNLLSNPAVFNNICSYSSGGTLTAHTRNVQNGGEATCTTPAGPQGSFDYSLSNSGTTYATRGPSNVFTQNTITKTLLSGTPQAVSLALSGEPSGVTYSLSNALCSPTCASVATFTIAPSAQVGTFPITVVGSPGLGKITLFNLVISAPTISVSCSASPQVVSLGQNVTWTGTVSGGTAPYTYRWSGTNIPTNPAPSTNPYTRSYSTTGQKTAQLVVNDVLGAQGTCTAASTQVNFNPDFKEF